MPEQDDFTVLADHERFMWGEGDHNDRVASAREFDAALGRLRAKVAALEEAGDELSASIEEYDDGDNPKPLDREWAAVNRWREVRDGK